MSFQEAVVACLTKCSTFSGRARRSEYWWFVLAYFGVLFIVALIDNAVGNDVIGGLAFLALFIPTLAVSVRRLHDTGRSGAWYLISFVPFGGLVMLIFVCQDSTPGTHVYGSAPKWLSAPSVPTA
jgi:uncharacterized membrane protein YhaH (DUF805 family)